MIEILKIRNGIPTKKSLMELCGIYGVTSFTFGYPYDKNMIEIYWQNNFTQNKIHGIRCDLEKDGRFEVLYREYKSPTTGCIKIVAKNNISG